MDQEFVFGLLLGGAVGFVVGLAVAASFMASTM